MTETTFKQAYGTLLRHSEALRNQREPNIDDLLTVVTESVDAAGRTDAPLPRPLGRRARQRAAAARYSLVDQRRGGGAAQHRLMLDDARARTVRGVRLSRSNQFGHGIVISQQPGLGISNCHSQQQIL